MNLNMKRIILPTYEVGIITADYKALLIELKQLIWNAQLEKTGVKIDFSVRLCAMHACCSLLKYWQFNGIIIISVNVIMLFLE